MLILASAGDSWTLIGRSGSVSCGITATFSWVLVHTRFCLCPPRVCFPVLWKFCNQIPLASKVKFPGGSQYLCQIPRLGNLLWALELSQQCKNFFGIIVLQFVGCLLGDSMLGLTHCLPGLLQPEPLSPWQVAVELCLRRSHSNTQSQGSLSLLWGLWVLVHKRFCLSPPSVSGGCGV